MKQPTPGSDTDTGDNLAQDIEEETDSEKIEDKASVNIPGRPVADVTDTEGATAASVTDAKTYQINQGSRFEWVIKKVDWQYQWTVAVLEGQLLVKDGEVEWGKTIIDMNSMSSNEGGDTSKDVDFKGPNFFDVATFPTATFEILNVQDGTMKGILTMKGISKIMTFPATVIVEDDIIAVNAEFAFDRTQRGINGDEDVLSDYIEITLRLTWTS